MLAVLARDFGEIGVLAIRCRDCLSLDGLKLVVTCNRTTLRVDKTRLGTEAGNQRQHENETEYCAFSNHILLLIRYGSGNTPC